MQALSPVSDQIAKGLVDAQASKPAIRARKSDAALYRETTQMISQLKSPHLVSSSAKVHLPEAITRTADQIQSAIDTMKQKADPLTGLDQSTIAARILSSPRRTRRDSALRDSLLTTSLVKSATEQSQLTFTLDTQPKELLKRDATLIHPIASSSEFSFRDGSPIVPSISSRCMSAVMNARNSTIGSIWSKALHVAKVTLAETTLPFIAVAATVEKIVYRTLLRSAATLSQWTPSLQNWCKKHQILAKSQSAHFTIFWSIHMLYHNFSFTALPVAEEDAAKFFVSRKQKKAESK